MLSRDYSTSSAWLAGVDLDLPLAEPLASSGRAWTAANWVFAGRQRSRGAKWHILSQYRSMLEQEPPHWYRWQQQREIAMACLADGRSVKEAARAAGVDWRTVYSWRARDAKLSS
jgi:2-succinyl-5-enolpyruvyl-6-hydroxy-3-cyclohexene-1-carboxylate synthase